MRYHTKSIPHKNCLFDFKLPQNKNFRNNDTYVRLKPLLASNYVQNIKKKVTTGSWDIFKNVHWAKIDLLASFPGQQKISKKSESSLFFIDDSVTSCKNSEKNNEGFLRIMCYGRTDRAEFIGPLWQSRGSNKESSSSERFWHQAPS